MGYILKGSETSLEKYPDFPKYKYKLHYLTLPILVNYNIVDKLSLGIGIDLSYLIKGDYVRIYDTKDFSSFDLSGVVGIDYSILKFMDIAVRYGYGITPVISFEIADNTGNDIGDANLFNHYFQISLRYNFLRK